jgi:cytochrome P450
MQDTGNGLEAGAMGGGNSNDVSREDAVAAWALEFDVMSDEAHDHDPYPHYEALRRCCPVARSEQRGGYWIVSRYEDIRRVMQDSTTFSSRQIRVGDPTSGMLADTCSALDGFDYGPPLSVTTMDPPQHAAFRSMLAPLLSPLVVATWEPHIRDVCRSVVAPLRGSERFEFVESVAEEIPLRLLVLLLGVPDDKRAELIDIHRVLRLGPQGRAHPDEVRACQLAELDMYRDLLDRRLRSEREPGEARGAILDHLLTAELLGRRLDVREQTRLCQQLARAGLHTTAAVLSNMVWYLSAHPEMQDAIAARSSVVPDLMEELMRWESIVTTGRYVTQNVQIAGVDLSAGSMVLLPLGSAGRDDSRYESADEVILERGPVPHLQFGVGRHRCLGLHLARLELRVALEVFHEAFPSYQRSAEHPCVRRAGLERSTAELWLEAR